MKKLFGWPLVFVLFFAALVAGSAAIPALAGPVAAPAGAPDLAQGGNDKHPWYVLAVTTAAAKTITLQDNDVQIVHLNVQDDAGTASVSGDYVMVMRTIDENGSAVSMATTFAAGVKLPIYAGGGATFRARGIPESANGKREIQIKAVGHDARVLIINGVPVK